MNKLAIMTVFLLLVLTRCHLYLSKVLFSSKEEYIHLFCKKNHFKYKKPLSFLYSFYSFSSHYYTKLRAVLNDYKILKIKTIIKAEYFLFHSIGKKIMPLQFAIKV